MTAAAEKNDQIELLRPDFESGTLSLDEYAKRAGMALQDLLWELDIRGIGCHVRSDVAEMNRIIEQRRRASSNGMRPSDSSVSSVVATQRFEGIDARPWSQSGR